VLYKIIAKVLANRLKQVLPKCVSNHQSTFVPERSILDNAMVAIGVVHYKKTKTKGKAGSVALKSILELSWFAWVSLLNGFSG
jgi:hypothetical protein